MKIKLYLFLFYCCLINVFGYGNGRLDSLQSIWNNSSLNDTIRLQSIEDFIWESYLFAQPDSAHIFACQMKGFAQKVGNLKFQGSADNISGISWAIRNQNDSSIYYFEKSLESRIALEDLHGIASAHNNIGNIHRQQGEYDLAIEHYEKSLKVVALNNDTIALANTYINLGLIQFEKGQIKKAIENYTEALKYFEILNSAKGKASTLMNIGNIHYGQKNYKRAAEYYDKSLIHFKKSNDRSGQSMYLINMAKIDRNLKRYDEAIRRLNEAKQILIEISDFRTLTNCLSTIASIENERGNYAEALQLSQESIQYGKKINDKSSLSQAHSHEGQSYLGLENDNLALASFEKCYVLADELGDISLLINATEKLWQIHKKKQNYKKSLEYFELYESLKDSATKSENYQEIYRQEFKHEYEKKAMADSILTIEENRIKEAELEAEKQQNLKRKQQSYFLIAGLLLLSLFGIFVYNRLKVTKKQKGVIELQKSKVEEQKKHIEEVHLEITDSINYAERIQRSFLATSSLLDKNLGEHFVYFNPKEAVSGDFYWAGSLKNGNFAVVNADSTGHGVPGAIMSILNISSIEKAVEQDLTHPAEIFNKTRELIIQRLKNDGSEHGGKDGMDASMISFNTTKRQMDYVAANNPIWIIRGGELIEIKAEKMPVGKHDFDNVPFVGGTLDLQSGDVVYTMTDGFQDQFGGEKGKKFKVKPMKRLMLEIAHLPMSEQRRKIAETFDQWAGNLEQIDDVCIIGIKIS